MHVRSVSIKNLRSIASTRLSLNAPGDKDLRFPNVNVILGDNGSGKSTLLRAIAMGVLAPSLGDSGYRPDSMVRRTVADSAAKLGSATVKMALDPQDWPATARNAPDAPDGEHVTLTGEIVTRGDFEAFNWKNSRKLSVITYLTDVFYAKESAAFFLVGYGATRRVELSERFDPFSRDKARSPRYARVAGLFEDQVTLVPLASWLPAFKQENKGRYTQLVNLINKLLPENCRLADLQSIPDKQPDYLFEMNGTRVPFSALSDGFKAYIGWVGDMLYHVYMNSPKKKKLVENHGVVLIDEIDLHLHPAWQRTVLPTLSTALPNVQFIVTTHSPLVVGSLEAANLFVLEQTDKGAIVTQRPEKVHGASAEQILLSPYFGLDSTRSADVAAELKQFSDAASIDNPQAALNYLRLLARTKSAS
jgi:predicted ATPase